MKKCSKCGEEKELDRFYKRKDTKDGYRNNCKDCHNLNTKAGTIKYQQKESSKEKNRIHNKSYWKENKEYLSVKNKEKYDKNREVYLLSKKKYYDNNRKIIIDRNIKYSLNKRKTDNLFKLKGDIRGLIRSSITNKGYKKIIKTEIILGITVIEFKLYLENKFESWMNWENRALYNGELNYGWDIDHIIPLSSAKTEEEIISLNHYTNLQPLCSKINRDIKRNRLDYKK